MSESSSLRARFSSPLARRLIFAIILASSTITLFLTAAQLYAVYRDELSRIDTGLRQIEQVHLKSLAQSLWTTSANDLRLQLEGIVRVPNLEYAAVRDAGQLWAEAGKRASGNVIERQYRMTYVQRDKTLDIGTLTVVAGLDSIYRQLVSEAVGILLSNAFKTFLVAAFALLFFHWLVNRHLLAMAGYIRSLDVDTTAPHLALGRATRAQPDELDELAAAINAATQKAQEFLVARRESEARLRLATEAANAGMWEREIGGAWVHFSPEYLHLIGYGPDEVIGRHESWESRLHPDDRASAVARLDDYVAGGVGTYESEYRLRHKDGYYRWFLSRGRLRRERAGQPMRMVGVLIDITARKQTEKAALLAFEQRDLLIASIDGIVWEADAATFQFTFVSAQAERLLGYPVRRWVDEPAFWAEHLHPDDRDAAVNYCTSRTREKSNHEFDYRMMAADGRIVWLHDLVTVEVRDGLPYRLRGLMVDITGRKRAEEERQKLEVQLRQSQKMEAMGTLAGGVAHDFNNALATIIGNVNLAREDVAPEHPIQESLVAIEQASTRARNLVQQILAFSRRQPTERRPVALAPVVEEAARLLRATLPARLALEVRCAAAVPVVLADAALLQQVLINLATNAMQAMHRGPGKLFMGLDTVVLDAALAEVYPALRAMHAQHPGRVVRLAVSDTGPGIEAGTLERIFEPFFTTKAVDEGTGLGLSVAHGIVQAHGGAIAVDSAPGKGTTFAVYLPFASAEAEVPETGASAQTASTSMASGAGGGRHILYLDDDEALVLLIKRLLVRRGYRVSGYTGQDDALGALRADPGGFDLVVTDYNMPGMSGLDVAREVRAIRPGLPVAVASGFIDEVLREQAGAAGVRELIFKTDAVEDFCAVVQQLLLRFGEKERSS